VGPAVTSQPTVRIYLVRHGEAKPDAVDAARPLSERGRAEVAHVARLAAGLRPAIAEIQHSGLLRARQTAEILAAQLAPARGVRAIEGLAPNDEPAGTLAECEVAAEPVMLVGHLPHLGRLASALLVGSAGREVIRFDTGTLVCLARGAGGWCVEWVIGPRLGEPPKE
jgi:phosphohistidine phosphatase